MSSLTVKALKKQIEDERIAKQTLAKQIQELKKLTNKLLPALKDKVKAIKAKKL